ncbi:hypothetical protein CSHISOI_10796, partial [Colletotrichum shisoi]
MKFCKLQVLPCLALGQLCASTTIDVREFAPRGEPIEAYRDNYGSDMCLQVSCDVRVCAKKSEEALAVASSGVGLIVGPDCTGWQKDTLKKVPPETDETICSEGLELYEGILMVWRAWNNVSLKKNFTTEFVKWEDFMGAQCHGTKDVKCQRGGVKMGPDPNVR